MRVVDPPPSSVEMPHARIAHAPRDRRRAAAASEAAELQRSLTWRPWWPLPDPGWAELGVDVRPPDAASLGPVFQRRRGVWLNR